MDYKDLADLIFPDAKPIEFYEEKYPERDLPEGAMVVRIGPSPTGSVHIGTIYQALIARTIADRTNGVFFMRVEDTDQKREVKNGINDIIDSLKYFDVLPDEGMDTETTWHGEYGPYRQSMRREIYQAYAKYLLEQGKAYPCFATAEELEEMRKTQEAAGVKPGYYGVWAKYRNLTVEEAAEKIKNGEHYIIRLKSNGSEERKIKVHDVIKGNVIFPENDQDIVIIKADGLPTYHFAHAVDDHLMHTTHVIRGDEWLSSVPIHVQLFQMLGFKAPKYAHTATILKNDNGNKRKISKRKDPEASMSFYSEKGYPIIAVIESLMTIINSNYEEWHNANPDKTFLDFTFSPKKMSPSGALYDLEKLNNISRNYISKMTKDEVYNELSKWSKEYDKDFYELITKYEEYTKNILNIEREQKKPRKDYASFSEVKGQIFYMYDELYNPDTYEWGSITDKEEISTILNTYIDKYYDVTDKEVWFNNIKLLTDSLGYCSNMKEYKENPDNYKGSVADISTVLRVALTSKSMNPDLYEIMKLLGKNRIIERINNLLKK